MAADLRWILFALSLVLLAGIWWWGRRRSSQAPGDAQLREITPAREMTPTVEPQRPEAAARDTDSDGGWGVPPFEPLSIRTQDYEHVPVLDGPMMVSIDPPPALSAGPALSAAPAALGAAPARIAPGRVPTLLPEAADRSTAPPAQSPNASEQQKIVTVRVCAP